MSGIIIDYSALPANSPIRWVPLNDGYGIVAWGWECVCGHFEKITIPGFSCPACGYVIPEEPDPDDWYEAEMAKPSGERVWQNLAQGQGANGRA